MKIGAGVGRGGLGLDRSSTLITRELIAVTLAGQGKLAEAEAEYRQVLEVELRVLGPDHPRTLSTRTGSRTWRRKRRMSHICLRSESSELARRLDANYPNRFGFINGQSTH